MKEELNEEFWTQRYQSNTTGWDLGEVSPPLKSYFDQLENKDLKILIPGCGNAYEAEYLIEHEFSNVTVADLSSEPLANLAKRCPSFPSENLIQADFFDLEGEYDLIIEQTLFCAIDPSLRNKYAHKVSELLKPGGKLVGVMFNRDFEGGPPFGGSIAEYANYFSPLFSSVEIYSCYNSIEPRSGSECFVMLKK